MKRTSLAALLLFAGLAFLVCCQQGPAGSSNPDGNTDFPVKFSPLPPKELDANATPEQLVTFAWDEFFALNWRSSYNTNGKRDQPDTSWTYEGDSAPFPDLLVWETYAHRTELRPASDKMEPFDNAPHYSFKMQPPLAPGASFTLFDNLDENNEIGSCNVYAQVSTFGKSHQVLYQAKVNRDEYDYLYNNYPTFDKLLAATSTTALNIAKDSAYFPGGNTTCGCPPGIFCLPCGGAAVPNSATGETYQGAMEVKTAWRELTRLDDPSRYLIRKVIVYDMVNGVLQAVNRTYALIGLHIIHKTVNYPNFIFATFEQVDVEKSDMGYVEIDNPDTSLHAPFPRLHPIPALVDSSTAYVHRELKKKNPNSIWQYYRLTGVQGNPTNDTASFSFFLANYVIESDTTLADFRGSGIGTPHNAGVNNLYMGHGISMGGCQGCHGVAQVTLGTDCSFLMDTIGKPVPSPDVSLPPTKFQRYLRAFNRFKVLQRSVAPKH